MVVFEDQKQAEKLDKVRKQEEEELAEILSNKYGVSYIDLSKITINEEALHLIEETDARESLVASFLKKEGVVHVAAHSPMSDETGYAVAELERKDFTVVLYIASTASLERAWKFYENEDFEAQKSGIIEIADDKIREIEKSVETVSDLKEVIQKMIDTGKRQNASRILEAVFGGALSLGSSDIHLEPEEAGTRLRLRLDGILQELVVFKEDIYRLLLSRIKLVSRMMLNVRNKAQDGRFGFTVVDREIGVRTSIIPGAYGESIVMRLLDPNNIHIGFEDLGINKRLLKVIEKEIKKPHGLILNTGPTGSGKTTSLYAFLNQVYSTEMKILTIENPVEYHLEGIVQTQVDSEKGYTFLEGLRSALRQDPDIIMVGEIRDIETARTAINAALTGHLVLSTLHTNNAAGTIPRLVDMGINSKIISSALTLSLAQRLVRKLCKVCKKEDVQSDVERKKIDEIISEIVSDPPENNGKVWRPVGCVECNNTGYKGRTPLIEGMYMDKNVENAIQESPSERDIQEACSSQGLLTIRQDGILKILDGISSINEVGRVVDIWEEL